MGSSSSHPPLVSVPCDINRFMGTWFVIHVKPTYFETTCCNAVEKYSSTDNKNISIDFTYCNQSNPTTTKSLPQKGFVQEGHGGDWKVSPLWPLKMPYTIIGLADDYSHCTIGYPNRDYFWIMARTPTLPAETKKKLLSDLTTKHGYSLEGSFEVPQDWTKEGYAKERGVEEEVKAG
eukprot:CAMPEP_0182463830 /NCGR_PEP_ID=MMETSP1319-20130603/7996_1 /TAXON_ID=172717 /ORGANISM="Bolidomonas pacifica, Strain RCC208" /LENGTH=176 /DNA_ID=CAMNT_0024663417 /DNA_START=43 /DNA_END=569 /DNA_ORIENTATION=-